MNEILGAEKKCDKVDDIRTPESRRTEMIVKHEGDNLLEVDKDYSMSETTRRETTGVQVMESMSTFTDRSLYHTIEQNAHKKTSDQRIETTYSFSADGDGIVSSSIFHAKSSRRSLDADIVEASFGDNVTKDKLSDDDDSARISAPSLDIQFQPLQPLPGTKQAPQPRRWLRSHARASAPTAFEPSTGQDSSCTNSAAASLENGFMNNMADPVVASSSVPPGATSMANVLVSSHTPPTNASSSYETSHFGKRPREGVSKPPGFIGMFFSSSIYPSFAYGVPFCSPIGRVFRIASWPHRNMKKRESSIGNKREF
jgi:hypothetical protein